MVIHTIPIDEKHRLLVNAFGVFLQDRRRYAVKRYKNGGAKPTWRTKGMFPDQETALAHFEATQNGRR